VNCLRRSVLLCPITIFETSSYGRQLSRVFRVCSTTGCLNVRAAVERLLLAGLVPVRGWHFVRDVGLSCLVASLRFPLPLAGLPGASSVFVEVARLACAASL
jgi:hypothetical protein